MKKTLLALLLIVLAGGLRAAELQFPGDGPALGGMA